MDNIKVLAKIHDILKLTSENHYCPDDIPGFEALPEPIKKSLKHHCITPWGHRCAPFKVEAPYLCIKLADIKASTISRKLKVSGLKKAVTHPRTVFKVWKGNAEKSPIVNDTTIERAAIFAALQGISDLDALYWNYMDNFRSRSEDARRPFSSLDTHNDLTARWASFFYENRKDYGIPEVIEERSGLRKILYGFSKKAVCIVRVKLNTNYKLSRLRDAKLIKDIPGLLGQLAAMLRGVALYELPEEVLFIGQKDVVSQVDETVKKLLGRKTNYFFETTTVQTVLENEKFLTNYDKIFGNFLEAHYPYLEEAIVPLDGNEASHKSIICDMCQMAPSQIVYPKEVYNQDDIIEEYLCEGCASLRKDADVRSSKLAKWEELEGGSVAFFKISLDMHALIEILKNMFGETFSLKREVMQEDLGFSILKEFLSDYMDFLRQFRSRALQRGGLDENSCDTILENLFCVLVENDSDIKPLVDEYTDMVHSNNYFSKMAAFSEKNKNTFPIRFSATVSNVKFPFMEHWQFLNSTKEDINIYSVPHTKLEVSLEKYTCLMDAGIEDKKISSALHKLAEIEERTRNSFLVTTAMLDMKNELKGLARYLITTKELLIQEALAYYKIMRD